MKIIEQLKTLVINRKKWGRGAEGGYLRNARSEKMCCLGFACRQLGLSAQSINDLGMPSELKDKKQDKVACLLKKNRSGDLKIMDELASVNDDSDGKYAEDSAKEKRITQLFARLGVEVKFVN